MSLPTTRREFLGYTATAGLGTWIAPSSEAGLADLQVGQATEDLVRLGLCADVHKDVIHDPDQRLLQFLQEPRDEPLDALIQLGDFCQAKPENRDFFNLLANDPRPAYHVLGNHEIDGGSTWDQVLDYYGMQTRYYSFDVKDLHIIVLDGNERPENHTGGYPRHIGDEQIKWLTDDLQKTERTTIVFSHQSLQHPGGVDNGGEIRKVLQSSNKRAGRLKVIACFSGHHHVDYATRIEGIAYIQVNSMSYYWVGGEYQRNRFDAAEEARFPYVRYTIPYRDPLWCDLTFDPRQLHMRLKGRSSQFIPPGPEAIGFPEQPEYAPVTPIIQDRVLTFSTT